MFQVLACTVSFASVSCCVEMTTGWMRGERLVPFRFVSFFKNQANSKTVCVELLLRNKKKK